MSSHDLHVRKYAKQESDCASGAHSPGSQAITLDETTFQARAVCASKEAIKASEMVCV